MQNLGLDPAARQANQTSKKAQKFKCWGFCLLITGVCLVVTAFVTPYAIDSNLRNNVKNGVQLTDGNEDFWRKTLSG